MSRGILAAATPFYKTGATLAARAAIALVIPAEPDNDLRSKFERALGEERVSALRRFYEADHKEDGSGPYTAFSPEGILYAYCTSDRAYFEHGRLTGEFRVYLTIDGEKKSLRRVLRRVLGGQEAYLASAPAKMVVRFASALASALITMRGAFDATTERSPLLDNEAGPWQHGAMHSWRAPRRAGRSDFTDTTDSAEEDRKGMVTSDPRPDASPPLLNLSGGRKHGRDGPPSFLSN